LSERSRPRGQQQTTAAGSGGVPTEKEVEDYQERKRVDERKQWDADFGNSESDKAMDRLRELRVERGRLKK
jgi:hypothetical protein